MAIDRVGQKAVCVTQVETCSQCPSGSIIAPIKGEVYTVSGFKSLVLLRYNIDCPGIFLNEVGPLPWCEHAPPELKDEKIPWPIRLFRPVDERKTDISDIVRKALDIGAADIRVLEETLHNWFQDTLEEFLR